MVEVLHELQGQPGRRLAHPVRRLVSARVHQRVLRRPRRQVLAAGGHGRVRSAHAQPEARRAAQLSQERDLQAVQAARGRREDALRQHRQEATQQSERHDQGVQCQDRRAQPGAARPQQLHCHLAVRVQCRARLARLVHIYQQPQPFSATPIPTPAAASQRERRLARTPLARLHKRLRQRSTEWRVLAGRACLPLQQQQWQRQRTQRTQRQSSSSSKCRQRPLDQRLDRHDHQLVERQRQPHGRVHNGGEYDGVERSARVGARAARAGAQSSARDRDEDQGGRREHAPVVQPGPQARQKAARGRPSDAQGRQAQDRVHQDAAEQGEQPVQREHVVDHVRPASVAQRRRHFSLQQARAQHARRAATRGAAPPLAHRVGGVRGRQERRQHHPVAEERQEGPAAGAEQAERELAAHIAPQPLLAAHTQGHGESQRQRQRQQL